MTDDARIRVLVDAIRPFYPLYSDMFLEGMASVHLAAMDALAKYEAERASDTATKMQREVNRPPHTAPVAPEAAGLSDEEIAEKMVLVWRRAPIGAIEGMHSLLKYVRSLPAARDDALASLLDRVHGALRGIDACDLSKPITAKNLYAASAAVADVEQFARAHGIKLSEFGR